jgi:hypothetical protein
MTDQKTVSSAINIGASLEAVREARLTILDILNVPHLDQQTIVEALRALVTVCSVKDVLVTNCVFHNNQDFVARENK